MEYIKFTHLKKLLTCQPYFIWNTIKDLGLNKIIEEKENNIFDIPKQIDTLDISSSITAIQARTYNKIEREFFKYIKKQHRVGFIDSKLTIENKIEETKKMILDKSVDVIFNPTLEYNGAVASPSIYNKKENKISNLKISASTKRADLIKAYFDFQIFKKAGVNLKDVSYFILDTKKYKAYEIAFYETFKINTSINKRTDKDAKEIGDYVNQRRAKSGNGYNKKGEPHEKHTLFEILDGKLLLKFNKEMFAFKSIDTYLNEINAAKDAKYSGKPTMKDAFVFGDNPWLTELLESQIPGISEYNGKIVPKKNIINGSTLEELSLDNFVLEEILKGEIRISDRKELEKIVEYIENKHIVWYDFEGFSLPMPTIETFEPYQQTIFQVSIIETKNMEETNVDNIIYDPQTLNPNDFPELIDKIYSHKANGYVVFNKGYENTRLKEMVKTLQEIGHDKWKESSEKVAHIINNTIDLEKPFSTNSKNALPKIFIPDLKGKYSIKLIEKYITKNNFEFGKVITPYKELEIQNGKMAMDTAINRVINLVRDNEWEEAKANLKKYCENDVRAMIMVFELLKRLLKNND